MRLDDDQIEPFYNTCPLTWPWLLTCCLGRQGAMQAFLSQGGQRYTGASTKSVFPGKDDVSAIYRMSEEQGSNYYDEQEQELLRERKEVKDLIDSLNKLESTKDEVKA